MMKLELVLPRDVYLMGENVTVDVRLTNTGAAPVQAPMLDDPRNRQPVFHLRGPSYPQGIAFSLGDGHAGSASAASAEPSLNSVEAGAAVESGFTLNAIKPVSEPGEYIISARMDWAGWSAEAAPVKFRIEKATFLESSLGIDVYSRSARTMRAVWIADSSGRRVLGESFLYEKRPDLGEVELTGTRIIRSVGPNASNPFCPWTNFDRSSLSKFWHGWQQGATLMAFSDDEEQPRTFDLASPEAHIVRPAIMTRTGDLEVLVLDGNRRTLRLVRFPHETGSRSVLVWTHDLPEQAVAARWAIGPEAGGGVRIIGVVSQSGLKMAVRLLRLSERDAEIRSTSSIDNAFALADSEPGISISPDGSVKASVLFATHPLMRRVSMADVSADQNGQTRITVTEIGKLQAAAVRAWTTYNMTAVGPADRTVLIRTADGSLLGGSELRSVVQRAPVVDALRMSSATYILGLEADRAPRLVFAGF